MCHKYDWGPPVGQPWKQTAASQTTAPVQDTPWTTGHSSSPVSKDQWFPHERGQQILPGATYRQDLPEHLLSKNNQGLELTTIENHISVDPGRISEAPEQRVETYWSPKSRCTVVNSPVWVFISLYIIFLFVNNKKHFIPARMNKMFAELYTV